MNIIKLFARHRADKTSDKYAYLAVMQDMADKITALEKRNHEADTKAQR